MEDDLLIDEQYRNLHRESVGDYETYWYGDDGDFGELGSLLRCRFIGFTEFDNTFPLAILELERPIEAWGVESPIVSAGSKTPPNTAKWVFRWPLSVNLIGVLDKEKLGAGPLARNEVNSFESDALSRSRLTARLTGPGRSLADSAKTSFGTVTQTARSESRVGFPLGSGRPDARSSSRVRT
jgi:hypothetical protein